ncbi:MAG: HAMP domain-containing histidine kinase, partial [Chloroflexi bacterium]|nr:HAMP domain-containing histidine kinase [Chloroflexota bacterium]
RLNALTGSLESKNQQLESLVYMVSHDLKAPLVSIQGYLSLLDSECSASFNADGKFYLGRLRSNAEHLQGLIRQLLELSRAGRVTGRRERLEMTALIRDLSEVFSPMLARSRVQIEVQNPLPAVWGDPTQIRQLFLNLLDNSIKYMGDSSVRRVEVAGSETARDVEIIVSDTGIGIPAEMQERVFQVFQRLPGPAAAIPADAPDGGAEIPGVEKTEHAANNEIGNETGNEAGSVGAIEGSGVGLAIVRKIADAHGGRVWVQSAGSGRGSAFHVVLPQMAAAEAAEIQDRLPVSPESLQEFARAAGSWENEDHDQ